MLPFLDSLRPMFSTFSSSSCTIEGMGRGNASITHITGNDGIVTINGKAIPIPSGAHSVMVNNNKLYINGKEHTGPTGQNTLVGEPKLVHITVLGNAGLVNNVHGTITVQKNAKTVSNVNGKIYVGGEVGGSVSNVNGDNISNAKKRKVSHVAEPESEESSDKSDSSSDSEEVLTITKPIKPLKPIVKKEKRMSIKIVEEGGKKYVKELA